MRLLDDNPAGEDQLGFAPTAELVYRVIVDASSRPLTIGVLGGWGSGKTSVMRMVEGELSKVEDGRAKHPHVRTVWFNAWKYSGREVVWNALIQTIFLAMKQDRGPGKAFKRKVVHAAKELGKYAARVGTRLVPTGVVREEDVDAVFAALGSSADDELFEFINRFETTFDTLVREWVEDEGFLVLFVDDLDRCLPEDAIEVLEALKLYLDSAHCVFVVGVDPRVIEEAIRRRYQKSLPPTEYLEKIIQIPVVLPRTRPELALELGDAAARDFGTALPAAGRQMEILVRVGANRNPRRIKRFFNAYMMAASLAGELEPEAQLSLAKVLMIQLRFPDFYRAVQQDSRLLERLKSGNGEQQNLQDFDDEAALRHFLEKTSEIDDSAHLVVRWLRVAAHSDPVTDEIADDEVVGDNTPDARG